MRILVAMVFVLWAGPLLAEESFPVSSGQGSDPDVAALTDSTAVFVYAGEGKVLFRMYPGGTETALALPGGTEEWAPAVDAFPDGSFVAAWMSDDGATKRALARFFDAAGNPTADPFPAGQDETVTDVDVAAMSTGNCVVTWASFGPPGLENVWARVHGPNSEPVSPVYQVSEQGTVYNIHPRVAAATGEGFTIVWGAFSNPDSAVRSRSHSGIGHAWYDPWTVAENAADPAVAMDEDNHWLMAWTATDGKEDVRSLHRGGSEVEVGGSLPGAPALASHSAGTSVVTWHENDVSSGGSLRARILDAGGQPTGDVFTVSLWTDSSKGIPGVAVSQGGRIVFTWVDFTTGIITGTWWGDSLVPVAENNWGSLKSLWR